MTADIVFVAGDVGGPGGMERQSEQLVRQLLQAGRRVTVIARTCQLAPDDNLRFIRVRTPSRPFALAYPAFVAVASLHAARRGTALLHTTGAVVANRADISTVHYCHRAAVTRVQGSRASRSTWLYRLNAATAGLMSRIGEAWCYRPERMGLLCAVSAGVASELEHHFPRMRGRIHSVPNGVDSAAFRPDPIARRQRRGELGLDDDASLAVFVGGDWSRKGLLYAVDALQYAPGWHLAVAGTGDPAPLLERARSAGTEGRVRFLGRILDTPRLYAAADAFVFPTSYEAFPLVTLEAAASGLPLLITQVNGTDEILQGGRAGWVIERDARNIAERLNDLRAQPQLAAALGCAARSVAVAYSWEAMATRFFTLYDQLARSPTPQ